MRSKPLDRILGETRELLNDGAFELLLIGQDTTSYGDDIGTGLASTPLASRKGPGEGSFSAVGGLPHLLRSISSTMDQEGSKGWIRLMYAYPTNFSEPCIDAFAELTRSGRLLPYLDIPLQHASDNMLSAMRRNVRASQQEALMNRLRERVPGMSIRTTFISGFPGETQHDHDELVAFVKRMKFEAVGVFEYSHEPGTVAGTMEDDPKLAVPQAEKARRRNEVMAAQQDVAFARAAELAGHFDERNPTTTGKQFDVIIDSAMRSSGLSTSGVGKGGALYAGRTYFQAPQIDAMTFVQSTEKLSPGEIVRCTIVGSDGYDLIAKPVGELEKKISLKVMGR